MTLDNKNMVYISKKQKKVIRVILESHNIFLLQISQILKLFIYFLFFIFMILDFYLKWKSRT